MPRLVPFFPAFLIALGCLPAHAAEDDPVRQDEAALRDAGVPVDAASLFAFIKQHTTTASDETAIKKLVRDLGHDRYRTRERATGQLVSTGTKAVPFLRAALTDPDLEIARRAERCVRQIEQGASEALIVSAARVVAARKFAGADVVLLDYAASGQKDHLVEAVLDSLSRLAVIDGKSAPALLTALDDKNDRRRASAAVALLRGGAKDAVEPVKKMLKDPVPTVRMRAGLALIDHKQKEALPVLIALLDQMPAAETALVEDLLYRLAGDATPRMSPGASAEERKKWRAAWEDWHKTAGEKLDLAKALDETKPRGYTLVVLLNEGRLVDLDEKKQVRWKIDGIDFPLDAQYLPGDRVLIAEYQGNRVTERNSKGEVLWEKKLVMPIVSQRLHGGNTFIATPTQLLEVDRAGKETWTLPPPQGGRIMKAMRLRNGDTAVIVLVGAAARFHQLTRDGKAVRSFDVAQRTSGGRVEVLPNGNVLLTERDNQRVVEVNYEGKVVWEAKFEQPVAAVRLPNGNTLVTSMDQPRAVEVDRKGVEVWEYRAESRVTRAWRH